MSRLLARLFAQATPLESLAKPPAGLPAAQPYPEAQPAVQVSTLSNGLKVATFGPVPYPGTTVGVFVNAGARYQTPTNEGSANVLRRLLFKGNKARNQVEQIRAIEGVTPAFSVSLSREHLVASAELLPSEVSEFTSIIADSLGGIRLLGWEIRSAMEEAKAERESFRTAQAVLQDAVFRTAFRSTGVGRSLFLQSPSLNEDAVRGFAGDVLSANRITIVGVNIDHNAFLSDVEQKFRSLGAKAPSTLDTSASSYVGGQTDLAGTGDTSLVFAFKGASIGDQQAASFLVLKQLLGGTSDSLNGFRPGDGASSYLGQLGSSTTGGWLKSLSSFNYALSDSGLLGVYATATGGGNGDKLFSTVHASLNSLSSQINDQHVSGAKARAKASILNADSRHQLLHLLGQQTSISSNKVQTPSQLAASIDSITTQQLKDLANQVFNKSVPTVVAAGDVSKVPRV